MPYLNDISSTSLDGMSSTRLDGVSSLPVDIPPSKQKEWYAI